MVVCPAHLELSKLDALLGKGVNVVTRLRTALRGPERTDSPVVIDCGPLLNVLSLNAVFACDLLLVPVSADFLALKGAQGVDRALDALEPVFKRRLPRRYVLTRYDARRKMSGEIAERMAAQLRPEEICVTRIRENVKLAESPARGARRVPSRARQPRRTGLRGAGRGASECRLSALSDAGGGAADQADDAFDVERVEAARDRLLAAVDDLAVVIHLAKPALGVVLRRRDDRDVVDALARLGTNLETEPDHAVLRSCARIPAGFCDQPLAQTLPAPGPQRNASPIPLPNGDTMTTAERQAAPRAAGRSAGLDARRSAANA